MFPKFYEALRAMVRDRVWNTKMARKIMRKSGFRPGAASSAALTPILSLPGARLRSFCGNPTFFLQYGGQFALLDGTLYGWGHNPAIWVAGEGAATAFIQNSTPTPLDVGGLDVAEVRAKDGIPEALVRTSDGNVYRRVTTPVSPDTYLVEIEDLTGAVQMFGTAGVPQGAYYVLKDDGTIWGQGQGLAGMGPGPTPPPRSWGDWSPGVIDFHQMPTAKTGSNIVSIAGGSFRVFWLDSGGEVSSWGNNLEFPATPATQPAGIVKLVASTAHCLVLTEDGEIWGMGRNDNGELGLGFADVGNFTTFRQTVGTGYSDVSVNGATGMAIKDGELYTWGTSGAASGRGLSAPLVLAPTLVTAPGHDDIVALYSSGFTYGPVYVRDNGCAYIWGADVQSALGQGTLDVSVGSPVPLLVSGAYPAWNVVP